MTKKLLVVEVPDGKVKWTMNAKGILFENPSKTDFIYLNAKEITLPTDEDIYAYAEFQVPIEHEDAFPYVVKWFINKILNQ